MIKSTFYYLENFFILRLKYKNYYIIKNIMFD